VRESSGTEEHSRFNMTFHMDSIVLTKNGDIVFEDRVVVCDCRFERA